MQIIKAIICNHFQVPESNLSDRCRLRDTMVLPRQFAIYYCKKYTSLSLTDIGSYFDRKHAAVIHSVKTVKDLISVNGYAVTDEALSDKIKAAMLAAKPASTLGEFIENRVNMLAIEGSLNNIEDELRVFIGTSFSASPAYNLEDFAVHIGSSTMISDCCQPMEINCKIIEP